MLHEFLTANRTALITRCRNKVAKWFAPSETPAPINHGVPLFLQKLVETLRLEQTPPRNTVELLRVGYSIDQVVREYGDVCQAVTELAGEQDERVSAGEFHTLNRCLDNAIADAVTAYGQARQVLLNDQAVTLEHRLRIFSDEQRRLVDIAIHSYTAIKTGTVGLTGSTGTLLIDALEELRSLTDQKLPEIRLVLAAR